MKTKKKKLKPNKQNIIQAIRVTHKYLLEAVIVAYICNVMT